MQARGFLNYRLKYCWPKVIYCICLGLSDGRYFTGLASILHLAKAGILKISVWSRYCANKLISRNFKRTDPEFLKS